MKYLILIISCIALTACSASIPSVQSTPTDPVLFVSFERGWCLGTCPVYGLTIQADGIVEYQGINFVKVEGKRSSKITFNQIKELVTAINEADFFSLQDHYAILATDLPSITLTITLNGRTKSIFHYGSLDCGGSFDNAPQKLCELERKIEQVVNSSQWVGQE